MRVQVEVVLGSLEGGAANGRRPWCMVNVGTAAQRQRTAITGDGIPQD